MPDYSKPELRRISEARQARVPWRVLEARHGRRQDAMRAAVRRAGLPLGPVGRPGRDIEADLVREAILRRASKLRHDGATWAEVAAQVGWAGNDPADSLRKAVGRYRRRMRRRQ